MVKTFAPFATSAAILIAAATATAVPDGSWPASTGTVQYSEAYIIKAGEVFDGKMQTFERSDVSCEGQTESGADTAVFKMEPGATLKNAIIGKNQMEGVHCDKHDCTIENVWWDDVCEDALSIKGGTASSVSTVTNCGARYADDKVIQHNGYGTVKIDSFYGEDISKLYRSCGTCGDRPKKVSVTNSYIVNPTNSIVTVNKNWGDQATLKNIWIKSSKASVKVCQWSQGNANGEPKMLGNGPSPPLCQYSESDVHINEDISNAKQTSPSSTSSSSGRDSDGCIGLHRLVGRRDPDGCIDFHRFIGRRDPDGIFGVDRVDRVVGGLFGFDCVVVVAEPYSNYFVIDDQFGFGFVPGLFELVDGRFGGRSPRYGCAGSVPDGSWPASTGTVQYSEAYIIKAGEVFDGKMQTFERSDVSCEGQTESGADTAVFKMEPGATLKNAIIGKNQMEGVHCDKHDCTIENVWWDDVCEDALSIKGGTASSVSTVTNCGARYADDKVIQHNGYGTVKIDSFYGEDISKLYRSCGTCGDRPKKVSVTNSYIVNPTNSIVTVNKNWGDQATLKNIWIKSSKASVKVCQWSQGNANGEPKMLGNGPSPPLCQYSESDVHINEK
ncbi:hypothetical protein AM588_10002820 [Phytophthora nicotianae]|uniref:Probable pectate lyase F n=1 Tax=Phytophthora nicotianae TaxID=4792 RepID=A0A0W8CSN4_PHYNI|nr:hypothetical protein AM588_10002820 [Phytophthora nicotianae]